jgi:hypothetical protein
LAINKQEAECIITQLQNAHRISVAFYRRILPLLDTIAIQLGCTFYSWAPTYTNRPGRSSSQPSQAWAWDYVPLYASTHTYKHVADETRTGLNDFAISFYLDIEDSFGKTTHTNKRQLDAVTLPGGQGVLGVELYRLKKAENASFAELWEEQGEDLAVDEPWKGVGNHWEGKAFQWPLALVICDTGPLVAELEKHISITRL